MEEKIFNRKIYPHLKEWKERAKGSSAILIEGARRIGKSTVAKEFARHEYKSFIAIDFTDVSQDILDIFDMVSDRDYLFLMLQTLTGVTLHERESVIIFDEIQFFPRARQAIKHLVADGRYDYIETGSLISIRQNVKDILIPSEEERLKMFPLDFEEFLDAIGKPLVYPLIRKSFEDRKPLPEPVHRRIMTDFRLYMLIGGMPQAVNAYLEKNNFEAVDRIKRNILQLYSDDFRKIDPTGRASALFESIPSELSRNTGRYKVGSVIDNGRASRMAVVLQDMADSMTVNFAYHADNPGVGLRLHANMDMFKLFLSDTGLFITLAFMDKDFTDNIIYQKLLLDKLPSDLGYVYENVVAQMLRAAGHNLFYYTFKETGEGAKPKYYEIDLLLSDGAKISPVEVKSSSYLSHSSLDLFCRKFSSRTGARYMFSVKPLSRDGELLILPVYMAGMI